MMLLFKRTLCPIDTIDLSSATLKGGNQLFLHFGPGISLQIGESCALQQRRRPA